MAGGAFLNISSTTEFLQRGAPCLRLGRQFCGCSVLYCLLTLASGCGPDPGKPVDGH